MVYFLKYYNGQINSISIDITYMTIITFKNEIFIIEPFWHGPLLGWHKLICFPLKLTKLKVWFDRLKIVLHRHKIIFFVRSFKKSEKVLQNHILQHCLPNLVGGVVLPRLHQWKWSSSSLWLTKLFLIGILLSFC